MLDGLLSLLMLGAFIGLLLYVVREQPTRTGLTLDPRAFWRESHRDFEKRQKWGDSKWYEKR